jgi:hypothetical protein
MIEHQHHNLDDEGKPAGGRTKGTGFDFEWNSGPPDKPNGATLEDVMEAAIGRLQFLQKMKVTRDRAVALTHLETALLWFQKSEREAKQPP